MKLKQIGVIHTPYKKIEDVPFHDGLTHDICELVLSAEFEEGLKDVEQATHFIVLYWLHKANREVLQEHNPHDDEMYGIFATRTQNRPNPIGLTITELVEKKGSVLRIKGITALDGTPLLDIKPYFSGTDSVSNARIEWFEKSIKQDG